MEHVIYITVISPYSATDGLVCCKNGWHKASKEAVGTQTKSTKKREDQIKDEWTILSRT
jgi:hypothetical protein